MNQMIVPRSSGEETTFALIKWEGPRRKAVPYLLEQAITVWVKNTDQGKQEWESSSHDFNLGDLCAYDCDDLTKDVTLGPFLKEVGFSYLQIETFCDDDYPTDLTYDTVLVNESQLEAE